MRFASNGRARPSRPRPAPAPAAALLAAALTLAGCGDAPPGPVGEPEVEIGTGMVSFLPLSDGQALDLVAGPQGGFHFHVHARMRGMSPGDPRDRTAPGNPTTWFRALDDTGARVDIPEVEQLGYAPQEGGAEGWHTLPSARLMLIQNAAAVTLEGRVVTLEVQVRDAHGRMAGDTVQIVAVPYPPRDGPDAGAADAAAGDAALPGMPDAGP